jgi:hypothetical protein
MSYPMLMLKRPLKCPSSPTQPLCSVRWRLMQGWIYISASWEHLLGLSAMSIGLKCRSQWPRGLRYEMSSPAWTLGSFVRIPLEAWMFVCVYSVFVLFCVGSGLATGWSLVQGVLPIVYKCKITEPHKEEAKARYGLQRHIRRRRIGSKL